MILAKKKTFKVHKMKIASKNLEFLKQKQKSFWYIGEPSKISQNHSDILRRPRRILLISWRLLKLYFIGFSQRTLNQFIGLDF